MANISKPTGLNTIWADGGTKIDPGTSKYNIGWVVQLPPYEYQNYIDNRQDRALAHINQHGVPEWDGITEYQGNLSYTQGSNGVIYKCIQTNTNKDPANTLNNAYWVVAFETFGSVAALQATVTAHITNYQTLSGIGNVAAARANLSVYSKVESDTRFAGINGNTAQVFAIAPATQAEHAVRLGQISGLLVQATESTLGVVQLATAGLVEVGTSTTTVLTPATASSVYLKRTGNLSGLSSLSAARANLGLGTAAVSADTDYLKVASNLSDITNAATARANLGITSIATQSETFFLRTSQNLADLPSMSTARSNLGLTSTATTALSTISLKADNLAGLPDYVAARSNLGLGSVATLSQSQVLLSGNSLSEIVNPQAARNNLGLGNLSTRNVFGVDGDLNLTAVKAQTGSSYLGNGLLMQWGIGPALGDDRGTTVALPISMTILNIQITGLGVSGSGVGPCFLTSGWTTTSFAVYNNYNSGSYKQFTWFAIGYV